MVSASEETHLLHNRLTHSIKVAQIARRLAERLLRDQPEEAEILGGVDPDVVEAASLAHDLGHPPFGHVGEKALDAVAKEYLLDAFEGNAQSFRIVTKLASRSPGYQGLNLTRATLDALLKYPWYRSTGKHERKWSVYQTEAEEYEFARKHRKAGDTRKSPEAEIMDWADDIAYSVHDVEDFYRMGLIPLEKLARDKDERTHFCDEVAARHLEKGIETGFSASDLQDAFETLAETIPATPGHSTSWKSRAAFRTFSSELIGGYVAALSLRVPSGNESFVKIDERSQKEVTMLKELTWHYVIHNPALATQQFGLREVINSLFTHLFECAATQGKRRLEVFPPIYREELKAEIKRTGNASGDTHNAAIARIVLDLISGFTEKQALAVFGRLRGVAPGSILDPIYF